MAAEYRAHAGIVIGSTLAVGYTYNQIFPLGVRRRMACDRRLKLPWGVRCDKPSL
jgi:hypothetical protein